MKDVAHKDEREFWRRNNNNQLNDRRSLRCDSLVSSPLASFEE